MTKSVAKQKNTQYEIVCFSTFQPSFAILEQPPIHSTNHARATFEEFSLQVLVHLNDSGRQCIQVKVGGR